MVDRFTNHINLQSTPLISDQTVTFLWQGEVASRLIGDFTGWEWGVPVELQPMGTDLWGFQTNFPVDAYIEYAYWDGENRILDPLNSNKTPDGLGHFNNYFYMPGASPTNLIHRRRGVPHGQVIHENVDTYSLVMGKTRKIHLYQPPVEEACPLLVVWDGREYLRRARLPVILDNLIAQGRTRPLALAMVENHPSGRLAEYSCADSTLVFLQECVLPVAQTRLNLIMPAAGSGVHGVLGASMGGLMALYTAIRLPDIFGHALCQSSAFRLWGRDTVLFDLIQKPALSQLKIWMDVGLFESSEFIAANREVFSLLNRRAQQSSYREYPAGHNYPAWRDDLWRGLVALFGTGPETTPE